MTKAIRSAALRGPLTMLCALALSLPLSAAASAVDTPASFAPLAAKVSPAVVNIRTTKTVKQGPMEDFFSRRGRQNPGGGPEGQAGPDEQGEAPDLHEFFRRFFGGPNGPGGGGGIPKEFKQRSLGSGVIVDAKGYVLTNNHVVAGADEILVKLKEGDELPAEVVGRDKQTDLALIRVKAGKDLPYLPMGDSDAIRVGDWVLAVGNPFGLEHTVTAGIVSAKGRIIGAGPYDDFIQTDASINPGNSGGPLIDMEGRVVGINTAIVAQGQGIGFAIPVNLAKQVMAQLRDKGRVVRGWLGVYIQPVTKELADKFKLEDTHGALVADVIKGGPAEKAGVKRGDVIVKFNGKKVSDWHDLPRMVAATGVGKEVELEVMRDGRAKELEVAVGELKPETAEAAAAPAEEGAEDRLGLSLQELTPDLAKQLGIDEAKGLVVARVEPGSPAAEAGIARGDLILEAAQKPVSTLKDFKALVGKLKKGDGLLLLVQRKSNTLFVVVKLPE